VFISPATPNTVSWQAIMWYAAGGFIGAGIGALYGRPGRGAAIGFFVQCGLAMIVSVLTISLR
jgi:hypothetical protein